MFFSSGGMNIQTNFALGAQVEESLVCKVVMIEANLLAATPSFESSQDWHLSCEVHAARSLTTPSSYAVSMAMWTGPNLSGLQVESKDTCPKVEVCLAILVASSFHEPPKWLDGKSPPK